MAVRWDTGIFGIMLKTARQDISHAVMFNSDIMKE
jgi:hypothetical protein